MDNRWGLTAENSKNSGLFRNKPIFGFQLSPTLNPNATATTNSSSNTGSMFTDKKDEVFMSNIVGRSDHRVALGEVDFFSVMKIRAHDSALKRGGGDSLDESRGMMDVNTGLQLVTANTGSTDQSTIDDSISSDIEDKRTKVELAQLQVELERMKSENWKLKETLTQVTNKYSTLQTHFMTIMQQQQHNLRPQNPLNHEVHVDTNTKEDEDATIIRPRQFMDLVSSGNTENDEPTFNESSSEERTLSASTLQKNDSSSPRNKGILKREESPMSEGCPPPNKVPKFSNNSNSSPVADHAAATTSVTTVRKARVSVRARSEAPMIGDGCQWRKYGQKMAKGNPCPRAYYRCTMSVGCPVRKQVQRCAEDRGVLITTYEGNHNHPLPPAAMAMASTTAAAASMLMSGSMSSADGLMNTNILARTLLPPSSSNMATISASAPIPTVTLDLTRNPVDHPLQNYQTTPPHHFPLPLNFVPGNSPMPHQVFPYINQSNFSGLHRSPETEGAAGAYSNGHNYMQQHPQNHHHASLSDTLSAATAAITADPNFTAALAAAISSIIGGSNHSNNSNNNQMASSTENTAMVRNDN